MRHKDYLIDRSAAHRSRLVPSDYMFRLSETLSSLPDKAAKTEETPVRVIERNYNKRFAVFISAAAVCLFAVTGYLNMISGKIGSDDKGSSVPGTSVTSVSSVSEKIITTTVRETRPAVVSEPAVSASLTGKPAVTTVTDTTSVTPVSLFTVIDLKEPEYTGFNDYEEDIYEDDDDCEYDSGENDNGGDVPDDVRIPSEQDGQTSNGSSDQEKPEVRPDKNKNENEKQEPVKPENVKPENEKPEARPEEGRKPGGAPVNPPEVKKHPPVPAKHTGENTD